MIITVTMNPAIDKTIMLDELKVGGLNRIATSIVDAGGKGINVSIVLGNLGIDNTALGFTAGFTGKEIVKRVEELGVKSDFIPIEEGFSRINLKLKSIDGTEINGSGPVISQEKIDQLKTK